MLMSKFAKTFQDKKMFTSYNYHENVINVQII